MPRQEQASVSLYWLPLGAGGWFARPNGRLYELLHALVERRVPRAFFHTALVVHVPERRFVIENACPALARSGLDACHIHPPRWRESAGLTGGLIVTARNQVTRCRS